MRQEVIEIALTSAGPYAPRSRQITMPAPHHSNLYTPDGCSLWCRTNSVKPLKATGCWFVHLLTPAACLMVWILLNKLLLFIHSLVMMKLEAMICHTLVIQLWQCGGRLLSVKVVCVFRLARLVWKLYECVQLGKIGMKVVCVFSLARFVWRFLVVRWHVTIYSALTRLLTYAWMRRSRRGFVQCVTAMPTTASSSLMGSLDNNNNNGNNCWR